MSANPHDEYMVVHTNAVLYLYPLAKKPLSKWTAADLNTMATWLVALADANVKCRGEFPSLKAREAAKPGKRRMSPFGYKAVIETMLPDYCQDLKGALISVNRYEKLSRLCWKILDAQP